MLQVIVWDCDVELLVEGVVSMHWWCHCFLIFDVSDCLGVGATHHCHPPVIVGFVQERDILVLLQWDLISRLNVCVTSGDDVLCAIY